MKPAVRLLFLAAFGLVAASGSAHALPEPGGAPSAADWAGLARLPDWSGAWMPDLRDQVAQVTGNPPPWTLAAGKQIAAMEADDAAGKPHGIFLDCLPEAMPSWMLISHNAMEILFTPGRVTMLGETDGNRMRRIYTDGRGHPADPDPNFHGHSVGRWEGDTLVVDTIGIVPEALLALGESVGIPNNGDMHVTERIHLTGPDVLADDLVITAPHILTAPWKTTRFFKRERGLKAEVVEGVCHQGDFTEGKDKDGNAVFIPLRQQDGNMLPPIH